jgi:hypothetical protein
MKRTAKTRGWLRPELALLFLTGCESVLGVDFDSAKLRQQTCDSFRPPPPPDVSGVPGDIEITAVVKHGEYGDGLDPGGAPRFLGIGYDIDENCSSRGDAPPCMPPGWTEGTHVDGPRGEDNAIGRVLSTQTDFFGTAVVTSEGLNESLANGSQAPPVIFRIRGYTGFAEDDRVEVDWFVPLAPKLLAGGGFTPKLDGSDAFPLVAEFVTGAGDADAGALDAATSRLRSVFRDESAYVTGHKLVAFFPEARIAFSNVYFSIVDVVVTADLFRTTAREPWDVKNGLISGKASAGGLLNLIPRITSEVVGQPLCTDNPNYGTVKRFMCTQMDLQLPGPSNAPTECNAASFAVAFETAPAGLGVVAELPDRGPLCPPATDPERDDCREPVPTPGG